MKTRSTFFSMFMMLAMLASMVFQVTPASAVGEIFDLDVTGTYNYLSGNPAMNIATGLTAISTPAGGVIDGAIVFINANFQSGDTLAATDSGGVTSSYNAATGVLTLSGSADVSVYQTVLGTVEFSTSSTNTSARTVSYSLGTALPYAGTGHFFEFVIGSLSWGGANAAASARTYFGRTGYLATINNAGENDFANTKIGGASDAWLGGNDATTEGTWQWVTGPEAVTTFCIGNGSCVVQSGWYANWNAGEPNDGGGSGQDYLFRYGGSGVWDDTAEGGSQGYIVEYGGMGGDAPMDIQGSVTVNVENPTYDLDVTGTYNYLSGNPAMNIATGLTATSTPAGGVINGAIVFIDANFQTGDTLAATDSGGVTSSYNAATGVLTLSGSADVSVYQTVLGTVEFSTSSTNTSARTVSYSLGTALPYAGTGHFFEFVIGSLSWGGANAAASARTYFGRTGYLATINNAGENDFATAKIGGASNAWLGGNDTAIEGYWRWVTGPEAGTLFCIGNNPCAAEPGRYVNWNTGEPNDGGGGQDYLFRYGGGGKWDDTVDGGGMGYVVEYGGMGGDTPMDIQGSVTVNVANPTYDLDVTGTYDYASGGVALSIATGLTAISTPAGGTIDGAIVFINANFQSGDTLAATDSGGVTSSYNAATGVLTLSGSADVSVYQTVLGTVEFSTSSTNTSARTVSYSLGTALPYAGTGHFFEFVIGSLSWGGANAAASARTYFGRTGYLATINDVGENDFATTKIGGASDAWLGGNDTAIEGDWRWVTGPEAGTLFCIGNNPCAAEPGWYVNWNTGEPNDGSGGQDYLFRYGGSGVWDDTVEGGSRGYVVEYGGMGGDVPMDIQGSVTVNVNLAPTIGSIVPNSGPAAGGTTVVITGTRLTGGTVTFGGTAATCTVDSATQITCASPAHAPGAVDVVVTTLGGSATSAGGFTYVPAPSITSIVPNSGPTAGGTSVVITGTNLNGGTVTFDGTVATCTVNTATQITCTSPAHAAGPVDVVVTTSGGAATSAGGFTYVPAPTISSIVPNAGPTAGGTSVVITDTNLIGGTATFDGLAATCTVDSVTQMTCVSPAHAAGPVDVVVTTPGGEDTSVNGFTYIAVPTISSIVPNAGPTIGGTTVVITGTDLATTFHVEFGAAPAVCTVNSDTQITCTSPAHAAGPVDVDVSTVGGIATSTNGFTYIPAPAISTIVPNSGPTAGGTTVVITGTNFTGGTVTFDGTAATCTVNSDTQITCTSPAHAPGAVDVVVTTLGGSATSVGGFTYSLYMYYFPFVSR